MLYALQVEELDYIADTIKRGKQSWTREVTVSWRSLKLRATIKRDFYNSQSDLYVEVWSMIDQRWNRVRSLEGRDYGDLPGSGTYTTDEQIFDTTEHIINELLAYAQQVIA